MTREIFAAYANEFGLAMSCHPTFYRHEQMFKNARWEVCHPLDSFARFRKPEGHRRLRPWWANAQEMCPKRILAESCLTWPDASHKDQICNKGICYVLATT